MYASLSTKQESTTSEYASSEEDTQVSKEYGNCETEEESIWSVSSESSSEDIQPAYKEKSGTNANNPFIID